MLLLLSLLPRACLGNTHEGLVEAVLADAAAYLKNNENIIKELEIDFTESDILGSSSPSSTGTAHEADWCHSFLRLLHEKCMAAYSHIAGIKEPVMEQIYAEIEDSLQSHENGLVTHRILTTFDQLLGKSPYDPIRHYRKTVSDVLYPAGSPDLQEAFDSFGDALASRYNLRILVVSAKFLFIESASSLQPLLERLLGIFSIYKDAEEPIDDECNSIPMARCCSVNAKFAQRFADLLNVYCAKRYRRNLKAALANDMADIDEWRSDLKNQKR
ncbi:hypothetical protein PAPHI01_0972 [Pancytospora philotis]|nr:hypothetical protein PAPHI01_0972 [Pancytospora philotis]